MVRVKGNIIELDGNRNPIRQLEKTGIAVDVITDGINGDLLRVENEETRKPELWQIGLDEIEVIECTNKNCSDCICERLKVGEC